MGTLKEFSKYSMYYQLPITHSQLPITHSPFPIPHYPFPIIIRRQDNHPIQSN